MVVSKIGYNQVADNQEGQVMQLQTQNSQGSKYRCTCSCLIVRISRLSCSLVNIEADCKIMLINIF